VTPSSDDNFHRLDLYFDPFVHPYQKLSQPSMTDRLEMLSAREQLMEDIDCIITDYFAQYDVNYDEELVKILCDAVCKNFPVN
tara:strand:+ start:3300 stop:3548 length:249 start_codon:yes stop_codon:yes gene_type:complete